MQQVKNNFKKKFKFFNISDRRCKRESNLKIDRQKKNTKSSKRRNTNEEDCLVVKHRLKSNLNINKSQRKLRDRNSVLVLS